MATSKSRAAALKAWRTRRANQAKKKSVSTKKKAK